MTNEEHIEQLKKLRSFHNGSYGRSINKAIEALKQEPNTDAVSRQDSLNMAYKLVEELASSSVYWDELKLFAKEQVQSLPPVTPTQKWIPVSERLPEKEGTYLLWGKLTDDEDYYCFIGDYDEGCEQFGYWEQQFDSNTLGCLGEDFFEYECVIAWMPLPKPYEPQGSEEMRFSQATDFLAEARGCAESEEVHCNHTDAEIAKSFIEDVGSVKDLLPQESEEV